MQCLSDITVRMYVWLSCGLRQ